MSLKKEIIKSLAEYFDDIDIEDTVSSAITSKSAYFESGIYEVIEEVADSVKDSIDIENIANIIIKHLNDRSYEYKATPMIDAGGSMICPKCYRNHGTWMSKGEHEVGDSQILKNGTKIILLED